RRRFTIAVALASRTVCCDERGNSGTVNRLTSSSGPPPAFLEAFSDDPATAPLPESPTAGTQPCLRHRPRARACPTGKCNSTRRRPPSAGHELRRLGPNRSARATGKTPARIDVALLKAVSSKTRRPQPPPSRTRRRFRERFEDRESAT